MKSCDIYFFIKIILLVIGVGCYVSAFAQQKVDFKHFTNNDGLSQSNVTAIAQDDKGFMWFCTRDGLNKYNGYEFTVYKNEIGDSTTISGNDIRDILVDHKGEIWVGTFSGLNKYNRKKDEFIRYLDGSQPYNISNNTITSLFENSDSTLWVGTSEGLNRLNRKTKRVIQFMPDSGNNNSLSHEHITDITEDDQGNLWIGTEYGLNKYNPENDQFTHYFHDPADKNSLSSNSISKVFIDSRGRIWVGTRGGGLAVYDEKKDQFKKYMNQPDEANSISHNVILSINEGVQGNIWIGTENGGLNIYDTVRDTFRVYKYDKYNENSISNNSIYSIYKDDRNNMWVGTYSGGINFYDRNAKKFYYYHNKPNDSKSLSNNNVQDIAEDSAGNIWLATDGGGLNKMDQKTGECTAFTAEKGGQNSISGNYVLSIMIDRNGYIWAGTWGDGVSVYNPSNENFFHIKHNQENPKTLSLNNISNIYEDHKGNVWICTIGGGLNFLPRDRLYENNFVHYKSNPSNIDDLSTIGDDYPIITYEDHKGNVWIGTEAAGLYKYIRKREEFIHLYNIEGKSSTLRGKKVFDIKQDAKGRLWVAMDKGLNMYSYESKKFSSFTEEDGLPSDMVKSILEDDNGNLWVGTNKGISKFNPEDTTFINFTPADGLQGNEFNGSSALKAANGKMYFGGINGLNVFHPDSIEKNDFIPPVVITNFQIFNEAVNVGPESPLKNQVSVADQIKLSYKQSVFSFKFAALNYTAPQKSQYAYKMEGFDKKWNYVGNKRTATYTNLNPGEYTFKVKASNNDGVWNEEGTSIKITITPPFWQTWYFKTFSVIIFAGLLLSAYLARMKMVHKQKDELEKQVQEKTEDIVKVNNELNQFAYIVAHDLKAPLRNIVSLVDLIESELKENANKVNQSIHEYFYYLKDRANRMQNLIDGILNYSRIGRSKAEKEFISSDKVLDEAIDMLNIPEGFSVNKKGNFPDIWFNKTWLEQIFTNLISNAIKYHNKDEGTITVTYSYDRKNHIFSVKDDGPGIPPEHQEKIFMIFQSIQKQNNKESTGIGLTIVKKIIEEQGGTIWVESDGGNGSEFIFTIPRKSK